jgi:FkbH-like protein
MLRGVEAQNVAIAIEWADLDPRLGYRASAVWNSSTLPDILSFVRMTVERLMESLEQIPTNTKISVSLPTLPFPPVFHTHGWQVGEAESQLVQIAAEFAARLARAGIPVVNTARLAEESTPGQRYDLKSDLYLGLPYTVPHASILASALAQLLCPAPPKKGIITDLDDTLWAGLVGEVGPDGVNWDLNSHSGLHGAYQMLLASLAESGVLVGVASKNNRDTVQVAFQRSDLLLPQDRVFPMEVHWNAKSSSVERILRTWNISADAVVFVDDSAMELAEVAAAHPGIECIQFLGKDYGAAYQILRRIRDLFGRQKLSAEDQIRMASIRQSANFQQLAGKATPEHFLKETNAVVHLDTSVSTKDSRALELVNKTNQFNLNGVRYTESDWALELSRQNTELMVIDYKDRFGLLGKIAVMLGRVDSDTLRIMTWVMSCRAFGRRIEHLCLQMCFQRYQVGRIEFDFVPTNKNGPLREFLNFILGRETGAGAALTREQFEHVCPALYHTIIETRRPEVNGRSPEPVGKMF